MIVDIFLSCFWGEDLVKAECNLLFVGTFLLRLRGNGKLFVAGNVYASGFTNFSFKKWPIADKNFDTFELFVGLHDL